jgi:hypothetical protein
MTHKEILEKAVQKATDNGWRYTYKGNITEKAYWDKYPDYLELNLGNILLWDKKFAKALWPDRTTSGTFKLLKVWEKHLMNMVIAEDPIKYLGDNLPQ